MIIVGIDPGAVHCGLCILQNGSASLLRTFEPVELTTFLEEILKPGMHVAYETFQLYPWKASTKIWSHFPEAELIGVIKYICEKKGLAAIGLTASAHKAFKYDFRFTTPHERDAYSIARYVQDVTLPGRASRTLVRECSDPTQTDDLE